MLIINSRLKIPLDEIEFTYTRSSGPGGQNVNKVNSKAILRWGAMQSPSMPADIRNRFLARFKSKLTNEGELILSSQEYRDQGRNVAECLEKLRAMLLAVAVAPKTRRKTKPGRGAVERRLREKSSPAVKKPIAAVGTRTEATGDKRRKQLG